MKDIKAIFNKLDIKSYLSKITQKIDLEKIFGLTKRVDSVIILDINSKLRLLHLNFAGQLKVEALKIIELPKEKKEEAITAAVDDFIRENKIEHKNVILKPYLNSLIIKRIQLPIVPEKELLEAVKWQIKDEVPYDLAKAVINFSIVKRTTKEDGSRALEIMCIVAEEEEIRKQVAVLKKSGLSCLAIGLLPFGYSNLLERYFPREKAPVAILHIGDSISYMGIYLNGKLDFFREIPVSVNKFKESLKGVLVSDKGRIELNVTEIEEVLFKIGIPKEEVTYQDKVSSIQILSMLRICLEQLESEIKRSLTYYVSGLGGEQPGKVFIAGGASRIPNLDNFLKEELKLDISNLTLSNEFAFSTSIDTKILPEIYADIGLALNYGKGANLVPYEFRAEKIEKLEKISLRWIAFIVFLLLFVSYFFAKVGVAAYKKKFDNTVIHLNALSSVKEIKLKIDDLNSFIGDTRKKGIPTVKILKIVSNVTPKELFIRDLTLRSENKSGTIKGVVKSMGENPDKILSKFIRSMEESRYFKNANISSVQKKKEESFDVTDFQISFKLP